MRIREIPIRDYTRETEIIRNKLKIINLSQTGKTVSHCYDIHFAFTLWTSERITALADYK